MLNIILLLIIGSVLTYISKFNLELVTLNLGFYTITEVPLFFVIVGSLLVGFVLSYLLQILQNVSTYFVIKGKSKQIKTGQEDILDLTKTVHKLEIENEMLKHADPELGDPKAL